MINVFPISGNVQPVTKVPAVQSCCGFRLNRTDSGFGLFVLA